MTATRVRAALRNILGSAASSLCREQNNFWFASVPSVLVQRRLTSGCLVRNFNGPNSSAVERAFQLAKAGQCATIRDIMRKLKIEGYSVEQLVGSSLIKQLKVVIFALRR